MSRSRPEHNFTVSREEWEDNVFKNAQYFTVFYKGIQGRVKLEFTSFDEAVTVARSEKKALLYAITESGRSVLVLPEKWDEGLEYWKQRQS